jgi:hypothetical protein
MSRPQPAEFDPYYQKYISLVPEEEIIPALTGQIDDLSRLFENVSEEIGTFAYAEGKWSVKEVLSHLIDGERMFAYRALRVARGDKTPIEGFEQDEYIATSNANNRSFAELLDEFGALRKANLLLVNNISDESSRLMGTASDNPVSARALVYIMAGHVRHHLNILNERYLTQ